MRGGSPSAKRITYLWLTRNEAIETETTTWRGVIWELLSRSLCSLLARVSMGWLKAMQHLRDLQGSRPSQAFEGLRNTVEAGHLAQLEIHNTLQLLMYERSARLPHVDL